MRESGTTVRSPSPPRCSNFDLAPLESFPPEVFSRQHDEVDAFILALALAFNDLKGIMWMFQQLTDAPPESRDKPNPYLGQWVGMRLQCSRFAISILNEVLRAISFAANDGVLGSPRFLAVLERLTPSARDAWEELAKLAQTAKSDDPVCALVVRVRNDLGYHYYQPKNLLRGYQAHFFGAEKTPLNQSAFASLGDTMEGTRFYFADASAQASQALLDPEEKLLEQVNRYLRETNAVLRAVVMSFLRLQKRAVDEAAVAPGEA
jgi:hypothetical protein